MAVEEKLTVLEEQIIVEAHKLVYCQQQQGKIGRVIGKIKPRARRGWAPKPPGPIHYLRVRALADLGFTESEYERWQEEAKECKKELWALVRQHPVWTDWAVHVPGLGGVLTGLVMAAIGDITRVRTASGLWKSFGLHVDNETHMAAKVQQGVEGTRGHPFARKILGVVRSTYFQVGARGYGGFYYDRYLEARQYYDAAQPDWPDGRRMGAAIRKFEKLLLSHFWEVWRRSKGLLIPVPYAVAMDPALHTKIEPAEAMRIDVPRRRVS